MDPVGKSKECVGYIVLDVRSVQEVRQVSRPGPRVRLPSLRRPECEGVLYLPGATLVSTAEQ